MRKLATALTLLLLVSAPHELQAQETPSLEGIQELARQGRTEEARAALLLWWDTDLEHASRRDLQRALWLRGSLTVDPEQATLDFRRLIVEYPGGPFSDQALFRLAQTALASGYPREAQTYVTALNRDYPDSPVREEAVAWLAAASQSGGLVAPTPTEGADSAAAVTEEAVAEAPPPVEAAPVADPPPTEELGAEAPDSVPPPAAQRRFGIQLGAFANDDSARALYRRALDAGLEARLVRMPSTSLLHVRVGAYDTAGEAGDLLARVTAMGFVAALVRDVNNEERIRR